MGRVTRKRLSKIRGDSFNAARILSSGETLSLPSGQVKGQEPSGSGSEFSKAGFCWISNAVLCSYQKSAESSFIDRCRGCPEMSRALREEDEEDEADNREVEEVFRRRDVERKDLSCPYGGEPCMFGERWCEISDRGASSWFCARCPSGHV